MKRNIHIAIISAGMLVLTACAQAATQVPPLPTIPPSTPQVNEPGPIEVSNLAPDFELIVYQGQEELGGETLRFHELLNQGKPVVLNFWAGLCPPCRVEMPDLQAVYEEYGDRMLMLGLDVGPFVGLGSQADARELLTALAVTYPAGTTNDSNVVVEYLLLGMPTTYFISPSGEIVDTWTGLLTEDKLVELVEQLLVISAG